MEFRQFCKDAYLHIKTYFKYINIANDVHVILGHVCDAIEANGGFGLGDLSEVRNIPNCTVWKSRQKYDHHLLGNIAIFSVKSTFLPKKLLKS